MSQGASYYFIGPTGGGTTFTGGAITTPITGANGTASAPTYSFTSATNYGWYYDSVNTALASSVNGTENLYLTSTLAVLPAANAIQWGATTKLLAPADGTLQVTKSDGTFGSITLGNASANNTAKLIATAGTLTLASSSGIGGISFAATQINISGNGILNIGNADGAGLQFGSGGNAFFIGKRTSTVSVYYTSDSSGTAGTRGFLIGGRYGLSKTTNFSVPAADSGMYYDNTGAGGTVVNFTLPAAAIGLTYTFCDVLTTALSGVTVTPVGSDFIAFAGKGAAVAVSSPVASQGSITLVCTAANTWAVTSLVGTWT